MAILTNEFQTEITDEFLNSLNEEIRDQLLDAVNSIPFIQNLISFERKRAKDLERDANGKIIVDLVNPHILEDMDYFRQTALTYKKYGKYTNLRPNRNPNSAYYKWVTQEKERIWYGMTRESDGEWIPGYFYFYLNYHPIIQTRVKKGTLQGERIVDFPEVWEGNYLMFHYIDQARNGGKYNNWKGGQHCVEIAKRGAGKAHPLNSNVPTPEGFKKWDSINIGSKLFSEFGKPITVTDIQEYDNLDIYKVTLKNGSIIECSDGHLFNVYKKNKLYTKSIREIIDEHCVTDKDFLYSIPITTCVEYDYQNVSIDAYTLGVILAQSDKKFIPKQYVYNTKEIRLKLLKGLLDTNGTVNKGVINFSSCNKQLIKDTHYLVRSLGYNCKVFFTGTYKLIIYTNDKLFGLKRKNGLIKQKNIDILKNQQDKSTIIDISYSHSAPAKCVTVDNPTGLYLIEDYNITHNSYSCASMAGRNFICGESQEVQKKVRSVITAFEKESLIKDGTLNKFVEVIDFCAENTQFPRQRAKDSIADMQWIMGYRDGDTNISKGTRNEVQGVSANNDPDKARGKRANLYIYEEFGRFKKFIDTWTVNLPSVQEGSIAFGQALAIGTGGTEGSDFAGALEIIYNPIGHHVYAIPNVYDRNSQGKQKTVFFFGAYLNRKGHYNENGVSDVVSALVELLTARYKLKYNSSDPTMLTRAIAENPITIQEAIMRRDSTIYPVSDLTDVLNKIDNDPKSLDDIWTGVLSLDKGKISYRPDLEKKPIRDFPHKDNKLEGCIEIHAMPETDSSGEVIRGRYIAGIDPYDDDVSNTLSLGSIFVLDLFTDQIVCEYTGRPYLADDFYEICRKILLFYDAECNYENNKKGLYKYFSQYNCLYLLSETLDFLKEREGNLRQNYGNKSRGTNSSAPVKAYGRKCIRNWMLKPIVTITEQDGVEIKHTQMNLELLKSRALIKELTLWNQDGNYDRHDALAMLMLLREDKLRIFGEDTPQDSLEYSDKEFLESDEFFKINFDDKYSNNSNPLNL